MKKKKQRKIKVYYAWAVYGKEELRAVEHFLKDRRPLAGGEYTVMFEEKVAELFGKRFGIMVNSGSSANLVAIESLSLPAGSEVITPVLTFGTTLAPLVQKGLIPVFADVEEGTYLIDINQIEKLITKKTKALMIPSLMGNIPDMDRLRKIARRHNLYFIEDSCDTIGATFNGKPTGTYSDVSTTSFYASHIVTGGGTGGMVMVNKSDLYDRARMFRGWGRSSSVFAESEDIDKRFSAHIGKLPYDAKFIFNEAGYNFIPSEFSALFGLVQLKKLSKFSKIRKNNFAKLYKFFSNFPQFFILPKQTPQSDTNWLALPLTIRKGVPFGRLELVRFLEERGIQTRPVFTGNVLKQPAYNHIRHRSFSKSFPIADAVMERAFVIGVHQGMNQEHIEYVKKTFSEFLVKFS